MDECKPLPLTPAAAAPPPPPGLFLISASSSARVPAYTAFKGHTWIMLATC